MRGFLPAAASLLAALALYSSSCAAVVDAGGGARHERFGCVVDAGSTGTRINVYQLRTSSDDGLEMVESWTTSTKPGVSSYAGDPEAAGAALLPLIHFAMSKVPAHLHASSPVFFKATAGMRLLPEATQDRLLESIRDFLSNQSPFLFKRPWAAVITGQQEGVFAWVQANYLMRTLGKGEETYGILDMGGASTQIAFLPPVAAAEAGASVARAVENLYSRSHLGFGLYQAIARHSSRLLDLAAASSATLEPVPAEAPVPASPAAIADPCLPSGLREERKLADGQSYVAEGAGDYGQCADMVRGLLEGGVGAWARQEQGSAVAVTRFVTFAYYYDRGTTLGLSGNVSPAHFEEAGRAACSTPWEDLQAEVSGRAGAQYASELCFAGAYFATLLTDGFGVRRDAPVLHLAAQARCPAGLRTMSRALQ